MATTKMGYLSNVMIQLAFLMLFLALQLCAEDECPLLKPDNVSTTSLTLIKDRRSKERITVEIEAMRIVRNGTVARQQRINKNGTSTKFDLSNNGRIFVVKSMNVKLMFSGGYVCFGAKEVRLHDGFQTNSYCRSKCIRFKSNQLQTTMIGKITTSSGSNNRHNLREETVFLFKVTKKRSRCNFCLGSECERGVSYEKQCDADESCFYMSLRDNQHDVNVFTTMGCVGDILFQQLEQAECWDGCKDNVKYGIKGRSYGIWHRYACTYCCHTDLCNNASKMQQMEEKARRVKSRASQTGGELPRSGTHISFFSVIILFSFLAINNSQDVRQLIFQPIQFSFS
eukprot:gene6759-7519_t